MSVARNEEVVSDSPAVDEPSQGRGSRPARAAARELMNDEFLDELMGRVPACQGELRPVAHSNSV
ncbi:hypothetical protein [Arthrobacter sp. H14]|uniref:hypothetical protein n=1 Tax=Arthrobacter sp. H14 TaxID=1312959 RepID=UPI00056C0E5F|nr:hypothetical protein [Arthrobacter sp. H14]